MPERRSLMIIIGVIVLVIVLSLVAYGIFVLTSVSRFAKHWDASNQQPLRADEYTIVALGDSTVQGIGATSAERGFVGQVADKLRADGPVQIYNYSKSGAIAEDVLKSQLSVKYLNEADVIMVAVGPNDINRKVSKDDYLKNYQRILDKLPKDKVVIATIPPLVRLRVSDQVIQEWNTDLVALAKKNNVRVAPVYDAIRPRQYDPRIYSVDLFHPSNIGYGLWATAFYDQLPR